MIKIRDYFVVTNALISFMLFPLFFYLISNRWEQHHTDTTVLIRNLKMNQVIMSGKMLMNNLSVLVQEHVVVMDYSSAAAALARVVTENEDIVFCELEKDGIAVGVMGKQPAIATGVGIIEGKIRIDDTFSIIYKISTERCDEDMKKRRHEIQEIDRQSKKYCFMTASFFFIASLLLSRLFSAPVSGFVKKLDKDLALISSGNFNYNPKREFIREFSLLSENIGNMTLRLHDLTDNMQNEIKRRTEALYVTQKMYADIARIAGRSEIAESVLHNMGNALTPAKIDTELLLARLEASVGKDCIDTTMAAAYRHIAVGGWQEERVWVLKAIPMLTRVVTDDYDTAVTDLHKIRESHAVLERIIRDQEAHLEDHHTDINACIEAAISVIMPTADGRMLRNDCILQKKVKISKSVLIEVLINLLRNALAATGKEGLIVVDGSEKDNHAEVTVSDTGCGLNEETGILRDGYYVLNPDVFSVKDSGLHFCKKQLAEYGGDITGRSDDKGTEMCIHIKY